jgi:hypothetical protein
MRQCSTKSPEKTFDPAKAGNRIYKMNKTLSQSVILVEPASHAMGVIPSRFSSNPACRLAWRGTWSHIQFVHCSRALAPVDSSQLAPLFVSNIAFFEPLNLFRISCFGFRIYPTTSSVL